MKIFTYLCSDPDVPAAHAAVARILGAAPGQGGKLTPTWDPVLFTAPAEDEARERAAQWWLDEMAGVPEADRRKRRKVERAVTQAIAPPAEEIEEAI